MGCVRGHRFDIARQGYVNLLGRSAPVNADTPTMLEARERFLGARHFQPLTQAVTEAVAAASPSRLLEVGAGTGHHIAHVLGVLPGAWGLASDISPAAARRAARAHPRLAGIVADTWAGLPLKDGAVDAVMCVFAPRNPAEFARVLAPGGVAVVAVPQPDHMLELRRAHGLLDVPADKTDEVSRALGHAGLAPTSSHPVRWKLELDAAAATDWVSMGPNAHHAPSAAKAVNAIGHVAVHTFQR